MLKLYFQHISEPIKARNLIFGIGAPWGIENTSLGMFSYINQYVYHIKLKMDNLYFYNNGNMVRMLKFYPSVTVNHSAEEYCLSVSLV